MVRKSVRKSSIQCVCVLSFLLGLTVVRGLHRYSAKGSGDSPVPEPASPSGGGPGNSTADPAVWRALLCGGGRGISDRLFQADLIARAASRDMPQLLELAGKDEIAREMLLRRWAEMDPAAAALWLEPVLRKGEFPGPEGRENDVDVVFSSWAKTDPAAALAKLKAVTSAGSTLHWTGTILTRLLNEDMAAGVRLGAMTGSTMDLTQTYYRPNERKWLEQEPAKAAALLSALPPGEFRDRSLMAVIGVLAKNDLTAAIALQKQFPQAGVETWDPSARDDFFKAWAEKDAAGITDYLNQQAPENAKPAIKAAMAQALAARDPAGALDWAASHLSGSARTETVDKILTSLAQKDPDAALAWLNGLNAGTALRSAVKTITEALADADPSTLLARAEALPDGAVRKEITAGAYEKMYAKDPEGVIQNLASRPAGSLSDGLWHQLGNATGDLQAGIGRLNALPPEAAPDFVKGLFHRHIEWDDSAKFMEAMGSLTDPAQREAAMDGAMPALLLNHASEIANWAKSLPAAERGQVADQMERNIHNLTDTQRKELITPLR